MQTRRRFLRSATTSLAGSVIALSFPFMGRASINSEQQNYIFIHLDISGISKIQFSENYKEKMPSAEELESAGYDVAYIEKEHCCREPFYPENHCAALNLANVSKAGFSGDFFSLQYFTLPKDADHGDIFNFDAENYISQNRDKLFCLYWKHTVMLSSSPLLMNGRTNRTIKNSLDNFRNQNVSADIEASVKNAVNRVKKKLDELDIAEKTTIFFTGQWQT